MLPRFSTEDLETNARAQTYESKPEYSSAETTRTTNSIEGKQRELVRTLRDLTGASAPIKRLH